LTLKVRLLLLFFYLKLLLLTQHDRTLSSFLPLVCLKKAKYLTIKGIGEKK